MAMFFNQLINVLRRVIRIDVGPDTALDQRLSSTDWRIVFPITSNILSVHLLYMCGVNDGGVALAQSINQFVSARNQHLTSWDFQRPTNAGEVILYINGKNRGPCWIEDLDVVAQVITSCSAHSSCINSHHECRIIVEGQRMFNGYSMMTRISSISPPLSGLR